jgi:hypothetical protein
LANRYWVGGENTWNATQGTKWSTTSGGPGTASVPTASDDVFFNAASGTVTVTLAMGYVGACRSINFTGFTGTYIGNGDLYISGNITLAASATVSQLGGFYINNSCVITSNGQTFNSIYGIIIIGNANTVTLADDFVTTGGVSIYYGFFNANNKNVTCASVNVAAVLGACSLTMGSGTWTIGLGGWYMNPTSTTLNANTSTIKFTDNSATNKIFSGGGKVYNNFWNATQGTGYLTITGSNTFNDFKIDAGRTVKFTASTTQTVTTFTVIGTAGNLIIIDTASGSGTFTLSKSSGTINTNYISITNSTATGGATWNAGIKSVDNGENTGWIFVVPPVPTVTTQAVTQISYNAAIGNGNVTDEGGLSFIGRGFVFDLASQALPGNVAPIASGYANSITATGIFTVGAFTNVLSTLLPSTTYYVRAFGQNLTGYGYGGEVSFISTAVPTAITVGLLSII